MRRTFKHVFLALLRYNWQKLYILMVYNVMFWCMYSEMITTVKLINISTASHDYNCVCMVKNIWDLLSWQISNTWYSIINSLLLPTLTLLAHGLWIYWSFCLSAKHCLPSHRTFSHPLVFSWNAVTLVLNS